MQKNFGEDTLELDCIETDSLIVSFKPTNGFFEGLKNYKEGFDFSELDP